MKPGNASRVILDSGDGHVVEGYLGEVLTLSDPPIGTSRFERVLLSGGGEVIMTCLNLATSTNLQIGRQSGVGHVGSITCVSGSAGYRLGTNIGMATTDRSVVFLIPEEGYFSIAPGQTVRTVGVMASEEMMERYLGGEVPTALRRLYEPPPSDDVRCHDYPTTAKMRVVAGLMTESELTGDLRRLQIEGLALALIAMQADALDGCERANRAVCLRPLERQAIGEARDRLLAQSDAPPSLGELAAATGLSEQRLNAGLREMFGGTAFELVRSARLDAAAHRLSETDIAIKQIAWDAGYQHVANFTRAFTARFGQAPAIYGCRRVK